jgi:hypothetical protein
MFIKEFVKKILYGNRYSSETYIKYLKGLGVKIGENSIIGAGSVVAKDIPANSVAVGNPAKVIHKIDNSYLKKYSDRQEKEAIDLAVGYYNRYKKWPDNTIFYDYFWLWNDDKDYEKIPRYKYEMELLGNYEDCMKNLKLIRQNPRYASFDEFIEKCKCLV